MMKLKMNIQLKKRPTKNLSNQLTRKTCDLSHKTMITPQKTNYKT